MFNFVLSDLQKSTSSVFGSKVSYNDVGLTRKQYMACENIDFFKQYMSASVSLTHDQVLNYGFANLEEFRVVTIRCHIYNLIKAGTEKTELLETVLSAYEVTAECGSLIDAFKDVAIDTLMRIGWSFWSIPLGSFAERIVEWDTPSFLPTRFSPSRRP